MAVAQYIRVSSRAQKFDTQVDAIKRYATADITYSEKQSAKTTDREELKRMLSDARQGLFTDLYVFKLDRLARTGVADMFAVVQQLRNSGVTIHAVGDNLVIKPDSNDITSEVMIFALGLAAKVERVSINDRIAAARSRLEAAGEPWGRPPRMTGQERDTAKRMQSEGRTIRQIAQAIGVPRATVGRCLAM